MFLPAKPKEMPQALCIVREHEVLKNLYPKSAPFRQSSQDPAVSCACFNEDVLPVILFPAHDAENLLEFSAVRPKGICPEFPGKVGTGGVDDFHFSIGQRVIIHQTNKFS